MTCMVIFQASIKMLELERLAGELCHLKHVRASSFPSLFTNPLGGSVFLLGLALI